MIIGIAGPIGVGKSTVAKEIAKQLGSTNLFAFADPIKEIVVLLSGCNRTDLDDQSFKLTKFPDSDVTYRHVMQSLGTEWARNTVHPDIWLNHMRRRVENTTGDIIIQDVRFENEAEFIRKMGGTILHIVGQDMPKPFVPEKASCVKKLQGLFGKENAVHASEQGLCKHLSDKVFINTKAGELALEKDIRSSLWAWLESEN